MIGILDVYLEVLAMTEFSSEHFYSPVVTTRGKEEFFFKGEEGEVFSTITSVMKSHNIYIYM